MELESEESSLVAEFFSDLPGYFVDVGANQPRKGSQTWLLEQRGWDGILVEPLPELAYELMRQRRARVYQMACSSPDRCGQRLPFFVAGAGSSLQRERMQPGTHPTDVIYVAVSTLDNILREGLAKQPLDFLSIDVEGHEIEVLSGLTFDLWHPRLILLEDHVGNLGKHRFMKSRGYRLIRRTGVNGWYVPKETPTNVPWGEQMRLFRKYWLALPIRKLRNASRRLRQPLKDRRARRHGR